MNAPAFTPGPWKCEKRDGIITSQGEAKVSLDDFPWKVVIPAPPFALGATGALVESEYNANLIAAAPLGYALAVKVAEHFDGTDAPLGVEARAFLAKARGERS